MAIEAPRAAFICKNTALGLGIYIEEKIPNPYSDRSITLTLKQTLALYHSQHHAAIAASDRSHRRRRESLSLSHHRSKPLFSFCNLSLGCVACVRVFMVVWPWVWVLLFFWACGHVCM